MADSVELGWFFEFNRTDQRAMERDLKPQLYLPKLNPDLI